MLHLLYIYNFLVCHKYVFASNVHLDDESSSTSVFAVHEEVNRKRAALLRDNGMHGWRGIEQSKISNWQAPPGPWHCSTWKFGQASRLLEPLTFNARLEDLQLRCFTRCSSPRPLFYFSNLLFDERSFSQSFSQRLMCYFIERDTLEEEGNKRFKATSFPR